ncbi:unannotated protein [freshwater metagenome]|uniref:Unannotated protein n=1 Tax=freshwater metagenome TaxID=449393 RepID=A0A6J7J5S2_9ZZZZ
MSGTIDVFLRMVVIGVAVAAPVGAMAVLSIQRTLDRGWRAGLATGAGIATADAMFAALAAFGVSAVSEWLINSQAPLRVAGGLGLLWLGWRALTNRVQAIAPAADQVRTAHARLFGSAVGLTLTNPMTIMAFAAIFAGAGLVAQPGVAGALAATLGVAVGSLLWWLILVTGVWSVRHAMSPGVMVVVNRVSGVALIAFGVFAIITGFAGSS